MSARARVECAPNPRAMGRRAMGPRAMGPRAMGRRAVGVSVLLALVTALGPEPSRAETTHALDGRLQIGVLFDSNVLEQLDREIDDTVLSIFGSIEHRLTIDRRLSLTSVGRVGLLRYRDVRDDSRVLGQGSWRLVYDTEQGIRGGGHLLLDGRDYADSASARGYGLLRAEIFLQRDFGPAVFEVVGGRTILDYRVTPGLEQIGNRIDASLGLPLAGRFSAHLFVGTGTFNFNRRAVRLEGNDAVVQPFDRRDEFVLAGAELRYLRRVFLSLGYNFLDNDSNSFGTDYRYHRFDLTVRGRIQRPALSLGLLARAESRDYADDLSRFAVINFDSEREENNNVIVEVGRKLREDAVLKVRVGWHRNESVFRDRKYDRVQAETHVEWQF